MWTAMGQAFNNRVTKEGWMSRGTLRDLDGVQKTTDS
jgi:hypothetical protein